jgi:hypothetical protein
MLKSWIWGACVVVVVAVSPACKQPDGPIPQPTPEEQNEIGDLSRDLLAVAGGDTQAVQDLRDDLVNVGPSERGARFVPEMAARFGRALSGRTLTEEQARTLAHQMYLTFAATALSTKQIDKIQEDVRAQLTQIGAPPDAIEQVTAQIEAVQMELTTSQRRWWQRG